MNIKADLKKRILSKIEEGYNEGGRLVEMGEVALYPDPAPSVDPTVQGSGKVLQVDSDLLRDLLNWSTSADAGSIDAVVAKAEEMGMSSPLTPAQLVDLTATAHTADPSNPSVNGCTQPDAAGITSPVVPAGPVGPLSPVMASFQRRGKKVEEQKFDGTQDTLMGIGEDDVIDGVAHEPITTPKQMGKKNPGVVAPVKEDDIIDSDNEVITAPEQMGNKNPGIDADGGETPEGLPLGDEKNKGNGGLEEDGVEDVASAIADGISDGIAGDGMETEPEVNALPGEGIPQDDDDAAINAELGEPGGAGLVGQIAALNSRVAELEALISGSEASEVGDEVEIDGEEGEEDELSISGDNAEDGDGEEEEGEEGEEEEGEGEDEEESDEEESDDEDSEEDGDKKLLLGDEEEDKQ